MSTTVHGRSRARMSFKQARNSANVSYPCVHPDEASDRVSQARQSGPPTGDHPDGSPDPASRSVDIRLAIRLLERAST